MKNRQVKHRMVAGLCVSFGKTIVYFLYFLISLFSYLCDTLVYK